MIAASLILAFAAPVHSAAQGPMLDGTAWKLVLERGPAPDGLWASDLLLFGHGRFVAIECLSLGFTPAIYRHRVERGRIHWNASLTTPDGRAVHWSGVREGRRMSGLLRWIFPNGEALVLPWRAVRRPVPAALPQGL